VKPPANPRGRSGAGVQDFIAIKSILQARFPGRRFPLSSSKERPFSLIFKKLA
jgi:hypothetical protein